MAIKITSGKNWDEMTIQERIEFVARLRKNNITAKAGALLVKNCNTQKIAFVYRKWRTQVNASIAGVPPLRNPNYSRRGNFGPKATSGSGADNLLTRDTVKEAIDEYLQKHGAPRRFEALETSYENLKEFFNNRNYELVYKQGTFRLKKCGVPGRARMLSRTDLIREVDKLRIAEGLAPIIKSANSE